MLAGELTVERDREAEQQLRMQARDESDGERSELIVTVGSTSTARSPRPCSRIRLTSELEP